MTIRLGFVGTGKWGRKLAESFRACGAEVVAYDRQGGERCYGHGSPLCDNGVWHRPDMGDVACVHACDRGYKWLDGFGKRTPWRDQLADKNIDAIVAVAPPEITTQVALACAEAGKAVMATKPLYDHPATIRAPFYVDFWRLWSNCYREVTHHTSGTITLKLAGSGPVRSFPGMLDYGPHIAAALVATADDWAVSSATKEATNTGELFTANLASKERKLLAIVQIGNGATEGIRWTGVNYSDGSGHIQHETPEHIGAQLKSDVMKAFCQSFIADVQEGFVDTKLLNYSREGMKLLRQIREMAK